MTLAVIIALVALGGLPVLMAYLGWREHRFWDSRAKAREFPTPGPNFVAPVMALEAFDPEPAEPSYEDTEAQLFATLQAAEYRLPYEPPPEWPLLEHDHDYVETVTLCGGVTRIRTCCNERPPPPPRDRPLLPNPVIPTR